MKQLIDKLTEERTLKTEEFSRLLSDFGEEDLKYINKKASIVSKNIFGNKIYIRGLIEITNYCRNDCLYCGIRRSNANVDRYRLDIQTIYRCCQRGYELGFRTFVFQGGEDPMFRDSDIQTLISMVKTDFPDTAITLSLGEKPKEVYEKFFRAGANRYLLRHETHNEAHYQYLHPKEMSYKNRIECLLALKEIGYQTGTGIMVGSPNQTIENIKEDISFIEKLQPEMIGIGPFLSHQQTPFGKNKNGDLDMTLLLISILRLMHPYALIPSTTALATLSKEGRLQGILAGANVVMPNLSPKEERRKYEIYKDKASLGAEAAEGLALLKEQLASIGYEVSYSRGDYKKTFF